MGLGRGDTADALPELHAYGWPSPAHSRRCIILRISHAKLWIPIKEITRKSHNEMLKFDQNVEILPKRGRIISLEN